jgi:HEAT repeat protein
VRLNAAFALRKIGAEAKTFVPQLIPLLQNSDANVRVNAVYVLGKIGAEAKTAVPQLIPLLQDSHATVRVNAVYALGKIGAEAKTAVPQIPPLQDSIATVQVYSVRSSADSPFDLFVKSIIQNPYIWGAGICLFLLFGTFAIRPL